MRPFAVLAVVSILGSSAAADRPPAAAPAPPAVPPRPTERLGPPPDRLPVPTDSPASPEAPAPSLTPVDPASVPEACRPLAKRALAPGLTALSARISLASCMVDRAVASLALCDCGESILAVDTAAEPALALLDEVIDVGDPASQLIAEHAEGELHAGFAVRLLAALPALRPDASPAEVALREMRRQTLDAQLAPWRDAAARSFQRVVELARAHPELADHAAVKAAVRDSQERLTRPPAS